MSMWNFTHEQNTDGKGANTEARFIAGNQPFNNADTLSSKRNVIATELGWVRRQYYVDVHGNERTKDEVLVAAHPGGTTGGYANSVYLGPPDVGVVQLGANTATGISTFGNTVSMDVYVTFNEPLVSANIVSITATKNDGSASFTLVSNTATGTSNPAKFSQYGGNNTLVFSGVPNVGVGKYKFDYQTLSVDGGAGKLTSWNFDGENANTVLPAPVSNSLMDVTGTFLANGEFTLV